VTSTDSSASRRSVIRSVLASLTAAGAGLFGVAHAAQTAGSEPVKRTSTDGQPAGDEPPLFSGWVTYGNLVFVSGKGEHTPGDITAHTTSVLDQVEAELKKAGSSMDKVLKVKRDYFAELGVRPFINAAGTYTDMTASLMPPEVMDAINYASSTT
jgi:2-iminobutanoate/2-iminopropanoate deaminase